MVQNCQAAQCQHGRLRFRTAGCWPAVLAALLSMLHCATALACRYTVRDIGFAEIRGPEFSLVWLETASDDPSSDAGTDGAEDETDRVLREIRRELAGSNISLTRMAATAIEPWMGVSKAQPNSLWLMDRRGRAVELIPAVEQLPAVGQVVQWLNDHLITRSLRALSDRSVQSFAQLLIIEGDDLSENELAHRTVDQALAAIRRIEPALPRPIAFPIQKTVISIEQRQREPVLCWALGWPDPRTLDPAVADLAGAVVASGETVRLGTLVAVVYGRNRLAGSIMTGESLELREVLAQLALVGESCECETDRAWLEEPALPFRWDSVMRRRAAEWLGFDPDSPLVRAEMLRIVSQGRNSTRDPSPAARRREPDAIDRLLLGYFEADLAQTNQPAEQTRVGTGEVSLPVNGSPEPVSGIGSESLHSAPIPETSALSSVRAQIVVGEGWDFAAEEMVPERTGGGVPHPVLATDNSPPGETSPRQMDGGGVGTANPPETDRPVAMERTGDMPRSWWSLKAAVVVSLALVASVTLAAFLFLIGRGS